MTTSDALFETTIQSLPLVHRGKVRDIYLVDDEYLLIVQTDRLSAFDVILPTPVPGKEKFSRRYQISGSRNLRIYYRII